MTQNISESQVKSITQKAAIAYVKNQQAYKAMEQAAKDYVDEIRDSVKGGNSGKPASTKKAAPPEPKTFNFGGSIRDLKAYLENTTGGEWAVAAATRINVSFNGLNPNFSIEGRASGSGILPKDTWECMVKGSDSGLSGSASYSSNTGFSAYANCSIGSGRASYSAGFGYTNGGFNVSGTYSNKRENKYELSLTWSL